MARYTARCGMVTSIKSFPVARRAQPRMSGNALGRSRTPVSTMTSNVTPSPVLPCDILPNERHPATSATRKPMARLTIVLSTDDPTAATGVHFLVPRHLRHRCHLPDPPGHIEPQSGNAHDARRRPEREGRVPGDENSPPRFDQNGVRCQHDERRRDDDQPVRVQLQGLPAHGAPLRDERLADEPGDDDRRHHLHRQPALIAGRLRLIVGRRRWRTCRRRRSVGQPTLGQRWREHADVRRRQATRRGRRARAAT